MSLIGLMPDNLNGSFGNFVDRTLKNQNKKARLAIVLSALGILAFISLATFLPFKDKILSRLYPKAPSQAAYVFSDNFDTGNTSGWTSSYVEAGNVVEVIPSAAQQGSSGVRVYAGSTNNDDAILRKNISPTNELYARVYLKLLRDQPSGYATNFFTFAKIPDGGDIASLTLRNRPENPGNNVYSNLMGQEVSTTTNKLALDTWYCMEMHVVRDNANGRFTVWMDGNQIIDKQNINTGMDNISWVKLGRDGGSGVTEWYLDNLATNDTNRVGCGPLPEKFGPIRSNPIPFGLLPKDTTSVTLSMNTAEAAVCKYDNKTDTSYDIMPINMTPSVDGKTHTALVDGLTKGNTYNYYVRCKDNASAEVNPDDFRIQFRSGNTETAVKPFDNNSAYSRLTATYQSISVYVSFDGDENENNSAILEYRKVGDTAWKKGLDLYADRRTTVTGGGRSWPNNTFNAPGVNTYKKQFDYHNQYRSSIIGLTPGTEYEVRVEFSDPDSVIGNSELIQTIATRSESYPSNGNLYYVAPNGSDSNPGTEGAPFLTIQKGVDMASAGDTIFVKAGTYNTTTYITKSGTPDNYIYIKNYQNDQVIIDNPQSPAIRPAGMDICGIGPSNKIRCAFYISGSYVRLSGFDIRGGNQGIKIWEPAQFVIIEKNKITGITKESTADTIRANVLVGGTYSMQNSVANITIQDNELHGSASPDPSSPPINIYGASGGHIIRRNRIIYDYVGLNGLHGTDCMSGEANFYIHGGYFADTDINDNYCEGATDDGIEVDGGNANVRVWGNVIKRSGIGFSTAPTIIGPTYLFKNIYYDPEIHWTGSGLGVKEGEYGTGNTFFYNNTFYLGYGGDFNRALSFIGILSSITVTNGGSGYTSVPTVTISGGGGTGAQATATVTNGVVSRINLVSNRYGYRPYSTSPTITISGGGGSGATAVATLRVSAASVSPAGSGDASTNMIYKNNIFHGWNRSISLYRAPDKPIMDYNIHAEEDGGDLVRYADIIYNNFDQFKQATGQETHGLNAKAIFVNYLAGDFNLALGSEGIDKGTVINGFNDPDSAWAYSGSAPDIGAYEVGSTNPSVPTPTQTKTGSASLSLDTGASHKLGAEIPVRVMLKTDQDSANMFVSKLNFPTNLLSVSRIDTTGSVIGNWVENYYDNKTGIISLAGGVPNPGYKTSGSPALMATIYFTAKLTGSVPLTFDTANSFIYRNLDNVDILGSASGTSFTITSQAMPTPTPTTALIPTFTPTPTPASPDTQAPTTPTNLTAAASSATSVNLSWTASTDNVGVVGYWIIRNGVTIASSITSSYTDSGVFPSTDYSYQVIAYDEAQNPSQASNTATATTPVLPDTQPPSTPTNLIAQVVSSSQINLSWDISTDNIGVVDYDIYRNNTKIATSQTTTFGDSGLTPATNYAYQVIAKDAASNQSPASITVTALTLPQSTVTPTPTLTRKRGDFNRDGRSHFIDLSIMLTRWNRSKAELDIPEVDLNDDGIINTFDFAIFKQILIDDGVVHLSL